MSSKIRKLQESKVQFDGFERKWRVEEKYRGEEIEGEDSRKSEDGGGGAEHHNESRTNNYLVLIFSIWLPLIVSIGTDLKTC